MSRRRPAALSWPDVAIITRAARKGSKGDRDRAARSTEIRKDRPAQPTEKALPRGEGGMRWQRRKFTREFQIEAARLVKERGVSTVQVTRDLDVYVNVLYGSTNAHSRSLINVSP